MTLSQVNFKAQEKRLDARLLHRTYYNGEIEASLDFGSLEADFSPTDWGLVIDASSGGCSIIAIEPSKKLEPGMLCRLQIDEIDPLKANVVWVESIAPGSFKFGLRFCDE